MLCKTQRYPFAISISYTGVLRARHAFEVVTAMWTVMLPRYLGNMSPFSRLPLPQCAQTPNPSSKLGPPGATREREMAASSSCIGMLLTVCVCVCLCCFVAMVAAVVLLLLR